VCKSEHRLKPEDEQALIMGATAALAAFGGPVTIVLEDHPDKRKVATQSACVDGGDDCSLTLIEIRRSDAGGKKRIDVFLARDSDLAEIKGQRRQLNAQLCLFSVCEKPAPEFIKVVPHMAPGAWLKPVRRALKHALAPVVAEIERRPLN
jgi:hypothetical protein